MFTDIDIPVASDPMASILSAKAYLIWLEIHHPHVPKTAEIEKVLSSMTVEERKAAVRRAQQVVAYGQAVQEAAAKMK